MDIGQGFPPPKNCPKCQPRSLEQNGCFINNLAWNDFPNLKYLNLYLFGAWSHTTVDKSLFFCR